MKAGKTIKAVNTDSRFKKGFKSFFQSLAVKYSWLLERLLTLFGGLWHCILKTKVSKKISQIWKYLRFWENKAGGMEEETEYAAIVVTKSGRRHQINIPRKNTQNEILEGWFVLFLLFTLIIAIFINLA